MQVCLLKCVAQVGRCVRRRKQQMPGIATDAINNGTHKSTNNRTMHVNCRCQRAHKQLYDTFPIHHLSVQQ